MSEIVYIPKPEFTIFQDTFIKAEIIKEDTNGELRVKVISVHTGRGGLLPDLTAEHEDEMISVKKRHAYHSIEAMQLALSEKEH